MSIYQKLRSSSLAKDYVVTFSLNIMTAFCAIIIFRVINNKFDADSVYLFSLFKRVLSFLSPIALLGLGVTLTRYISSSKVAVVKRQYLGIAFLCVSILPISLLILNFLIPEYFNGLLWGNTNVDIRLSRYLLVNVWGLTNVSLMISYFRGDNKYLLSSMSNLLIVGLIPLLVVYFTAQFLYFLYAYSLLILIISSFCIIWIVLIGFKVKSNSVFEIEKIGTKRFIIDGLSRVIGDFSFYLLLLIPSFLVIHYYEDIKAAATFSIALTLMGIIQTFIQPISFITLTRAVKLKGDDSIKLKKEATNVFSIVFILSILAYLCMLVLIKYIISYFFTVDLLDNIAQIRLFLLSLPFYISFISCRSYIDGSTTVPVVPIFTTAALIVFVSAFFVLAKFVPGPFNPIITSFLTSSITLFLLTYWYIKAKL